MPLAFRSRSHGTVAFGFFNIDSDMLLLEELFFFADRFCAAVLELAQGVANASSQRGSSDDLSVAIDGWRIADRVRIGNLHGAIAGVDHSGFIGATYERYPFPAQPEGFKQSPEGASTQQEMAELIETFGAQARIELCWAPPSGDVRLGEYAFTEQAFAELIAYVEQGGYPRYRDEQRPSYVQEMVAALHQLSSPWLSAVDARRAASP